MKLLEDELSKHLDPALTKELFTEFYETKTAYWLGDIKKTIIHSGQFAEACIAILLKLSKPSQIIDLNKIEFEIFFNKLMQLPKKTANEELLFLVIPQVIKSVYTVRSKKRIAHLKINNAEQVDSEMIVTSCNWVMCQFISLYCDFASEEVERLVNSIIERKVPTIEKFEDGEIMVLKKDLSFKEKLLLVLYQFPRRMKTKEIINIIRPPKDSYISTYLKLLYKDLLIHLNDQGAIINKNGIKEIECNKTKYFTWSH